MWWIVGAVVWVALLLVLLNRKNLRALLEGCAFVAIVLSVAAATLGLVIVVFMWIPHYLFGDIGLGVGLATLVSAVLYGALYEDYRSHGKALKSFAVLAVMVVPVLFMLAKAGV